MPTADAFEWPQGEPLFEVMWRSVTESLAGNGIVNNGDFQVTATATTREIQVAAGTYFSVATETTLGAAETHVVSTGDANDDRWDTVWFDTGTGASGVTEGTPAANPEPPDVTGDQEPLAFLYVPANFDTAFSSDQILNWRATFSNEAQEVHYDDSTGVYSVSNVDAALDELQEAAQISAYPLAIGDLANPFGLDELTDMDADGTDLTDGATVIWDTSASEVPQAQLGGPASSLSAYPLVSADIATDAVTDSEIDATLSITWTGVHTYDAAEQMAEVTTPSTPPAGYNSLYFKSDDLLYKLDEGGNEATVGALVIEDDGATVVSAATSLGMGAGLSATDGGGGDVTAAYEHAEVFEGRETGTVANGDQGILIIDHLANNETVEVYKAVLVNADGSAVATSVDLELVTLDNAGGFTSRATLITGDGSTVFDDETGSPLGSYTNTSGGGQTIAVFVDNGSGGSVDIVAAAEGVTAA